MLPRKARLSDLISSTLLEAMAVKLDIPYRDKVFLLRCNRISFEHCRRSVPLCTDLKKKQSEDASPTLDYRACAANGRMLASGYGSVY